ncbi:MAG: asparagine synthase (glutamine-hydrolyzing), partial [Alphaproteobacteria bacterium]
RLALAAQTPAGAQPMVKDELVIVFNGLIYTTRELRNELATKGHFFTSDTDTEVLLAGWREWGEGLLPRLSGMFAFAIWNQATRELFLARDRFGKKPLLYKQAGSRLLFGSDLRALQWLDGSRGEIDRASLALYFSLRFVPEPRSIMDGVAKVPPGYLVKYSSRGLEVRRWYNLADAHGPSYATEEEAAEELRERLTEAVKGRLIADVPVGAFLSGGVDSAIVAAVMSRLTNKVRTFTVGFEGSSDYYEERPAAKAVADFLGTDHTEIAVTPGETEAVVNDVFDALDEPFADSSAVPTFIVSKATRQHVTVALTGDGSDEVFGGYRRYQGELLAANYQLLPWPVRKYFFEPLARIVPEGKDNRFLERLRRFRRFIAYAGERDTKRHAGWTALMGDAEIQKLFAEPVEYPPVEQLIEELRDATRAKDPINRLLAADIALGLPGDMLVKADRMSMANSLELRCPFLDHAVVECAASMPGSYKLRRGVGKYILKRAFHDSLPPLVFQRPKRGFEIPIGAWLIGPLRGLVEHAIDPVRLKSQGILRPELPAQWLTDLVSGRRDTSWHLWTVIAFQAWLERQVP